MKSKLQILGIAIAAVFVIWIVFALLGIAVEIVMTKIFLLALIVGSFIMFKKDPKGIYKYVLAGSMLLGVFVFDMIINIIFMLIVLIMIQIVRRVNVKQFGPIQITLIVFAIVYILLFGFAATIAKLIAVFAVVALFIAIVWKELKIYFTPTPIQTGDEVDFVDENPSHKAAKIKEQLGKYVNMDLMTKNIALNIGFTLYILLVTIQMLSELIYAIIPFKF